MTANTLRLGKVTRVTAAGETEELELKPGVNAIVGVKDTGKSGWMNTISFLLGDDKPPEKTLGSLARHFRAAELAMAIDGNSFRVERRWQEPGAKQRVFLNGKPMSADDFSLWLESELGLPFLRFPKGNPYSGQWVHLSWRTLFRHIYRRERFWSELADRLWIGFLRTTLNALTSTRI